MKTILLLSLSMVGTAILIFIVPPILAWLAAEKGWIL